MKKLIQSSFLSYLRIATQLQLRKNNPLIVGVTGSAGKTSAVKAIGLVLETKYTVKYTKKGNSETGLPLEILNIPVGNFSLSDWFRIALLSIWKLVSYWPHYDILVAEMGIDSPDEPKNMSYLLKLISPKIGVFLSLTSVHAQNFSGSNLLESIANEKAKLLHNLPPDGLAVYSLDYPEILSATKGIQSQQATFSDSNKNAHIWLETHQVSLEKTTFDFYFRSQVYTLAFRNMCLFKETFGTFASALLIADHLGIGLPAAIAALEKSYQLEPGRMSVFPGLNGSTLIDSTYNSSLVPTSSALKLLKTLATSGKKIAVIGDMRELGENAQSDHEKLADVVAETSDYVFLVGPLTQQHTYPRLLEKGFSKGRVHSFITAYEALPLIKATVDEKDIVLLKGSQNTIFLEIIVKELLANPADAQFLCRQTPYWEQQRQKLLELKKSSV